MKKKKPRFHLLYKLICVGIFTQVAVIATCVLVYLYPSLPEDSIRTFRSVAQTCGKWVDSGRQRIAKWLDSPDTPSSDEILPQPKTEAEVETARASDSPDVSNTDRTQTFTPSKELGTASDLEISDVPEDIASYYIMLDTAMGPMMYYNQGDSRWADYLYGGEDPMSGYGCGPTSVSMLVSSFSQEGGGLSPVELADWADENGFHASQGGSYHTLIESALASYGFTVEGVTNRTVENAAALLDNGHVLVALVKKGTFTQSSGHFILITKLLDNGNVWIADPNSYENSRKEWELDLLLSELKTGASGGGPLWSVSLPEQ